ncbi:MAG: aminomethyl transferase family protein [Phycisphaerales bacterium]|nr:aminomethyl transferase family protein [Phycisphaerales bacterium]
MGRETPLRPLHEQAGAMLAVYGPTEGVGGVPVDVPQIFGELEIEYAAIRKHAGLLDQATRATIELTGGDRLDFLNRMLTQELKGVQPGSVRRAFWLNRKGRIDADMHVVHLANRTLIDVDILALERTTTSLASFIITEDASLREMSGQMYRLAIHGPTTPDLLSGLGASLPPDGGATEATIADVPVTMWRFDATGEIGIEILCAMSDAAGLYSTLIDRAGEQESGAAALRAGDPSSLNRRVRLARVGWHAFNIARIEAGTPLYNIDFGPESLPAESGVLGDRVSFTKGCYLGQEIVARMHSRGHPKQCLVALRLDRVLNSATGEPSLPNSGAAVLDSGGVPIGAVTSSTVAPMLGAAPVCFAQVKWEQSKPGTELSVQTDSGVVKGAVQESLAFWKRGK